VKPASLTNHAKLRVSERCSLTPEAVKQILDHSGTVHISLQKGGRYAHRLLYSSTDEEWFIVVQDGGDGGVLTVMPLDYLKDRTTVTAAQKRQARKRAADALKAAQQPVVEVVLAETPPLPAADPSAPVASPASLPGWKIRVRYMIQGKSHFKTVGRTLAEHGEPASWDQPGPINNWLKVRLMEASIPFGAVEAILAERKSVTHVIDALLEHLPLTEHEILACYAPFGAGAKSENPTA
jgi:hypothetical protein